MDELENKIKAFLEVFKRARKRKGMTVGEIRSIAKEYNIEENLFFEAIVTGDSNLSADILGVPREILNEAVTKAMTAN